MTGSKFEVKFTTPDEGFDLRNEILRPAGTAPFKGIEGENLDTSFHVGCFLDGHIISIATFLKKSNSLFSQQYQYFMRGMVTHPDYQGQGAGSSVIDFGINELKKRNVNFLWFNARINAVPFYEKNGFSSIGEEFLIPEIGMHVVMYKSL